MGHAFSLHERDLVVFGALRSGSTLLRLMIDAHPELQCNGEHDYLFEYIRYDEERERWIIDRSQLLLDRIFISHKISCPETLDAQAAISDMVAQLRKKGSGRLVLMVHRNLRAVTALLKEPLLIHLIRDPRDVASSSIGMGWAGNVYYGADHWISTETEWIEVSPRISEESVFTLRFECLISDPETQLKGLCRFVGVDFSPQMLEYHRVTTYAAVDPTLASQWHRKRTSREIALVELRVGDLLFSSGFEKSNVEAISLSFFERVKLWCQNRLYIWRVRVNRYGIRDSVWVAVARRLGLESWARPAIVRINNKTIQYLK
jgi:hypothetical protein